MPGLLQLRMQALETMDMEVTMAMQVISKNVMGLSIPVIGL
jgi:hypothetical protein